MNQRPHLFSMDYVVWERGALHHDMLISQTVAVRTGLGVFVHDNLLREVIMGKQALLATATQDPPQLPEGVVTAIAGEEEDEELFQRISPIDSVRTALLPATLTDDPWVNEELKGPLSEVFGPLPPEPADVPPLEFDMDEERVRQMTYGKTKPTKISSSSPRQFDVMSAHFSELKAAGIMGNAFPHYPPGPIASIAFTVAKPGTSRIPRPELYGNRHPLTMAQKKSFEAYATSLTAERLVVNLQPVNTFAVVQNYPLPSVRENLAKLSKFKYFAKIDLTKAFWSLPLHQRCIKWTYTIAAGGLTGVWLRAPMGLAPVPGYFMWVLSGVLSKQAAFTLLYADDILVGGNSMEELRSNIREVLSTLLNRGFRVSAGKCQFQPLQKITYLGWEIQNGQISAAPSTLDKLFKVKKPDDMMSCKDDKAKIQVVRRFLGVLQYLSHYVPCNAEQLRPLYDLTKSSPEDYKQKGKAPTSNSASSGENDKPRQRRAKFVWTKAADEAWDWACERMSKIQPLHTPTYAPNTWLEVVSDASKFGWGGVLLEWTEGDHVPRIVCCVSGTFTGSQLNWATCTKEMFGVWSTVRKFRAFLHLHHFVLSTDHRNLLWGAMSANEMVLRMSTDLQQHKFVMRHVEGSSNILCDYISRAEYSTATEVDRIRRRSLSAPPTTLVENAGRTTNSRRATSSTAPLEPLSPLAPPSAPTESSHHHQSKVTGNLGYPVSIFGTNFQSAESSDISVYSARGMFMLGESTEASSAPECLNSSDAHSGEEEIGFGQAMPIDGAVQQQDPQVQPAQPVQLNAPRARQRRRHRARRQPQPPEPWHPQGEDDGLPIPHMLPHPSPRPRRLTASQYHTLKSLHGGILPHTGVAPLLTALANAGHNWEGIAEDAAEFVARCHYCQLERLTRRGPQSLPYRSVQIPSTLCELWHFDILGPLPPCAITGARYILVCIEDASKLVMLGRSVDASIMEIMFFIIDCFKIFGFPHTIKTDKGGQYLSKALQQLFHCTGIEHKVGIAYYHQSDAIVENAAALVWPYLRIMCQEIRKYHAWTPLLCNVQLGANALMREVLGGASASEIMFSRKVRPLGFLRPEALRNEQGVAVEVNKFIADQAALQLRLLGTADAERHRRYVNNSDIANQAREGLEHLDWVTVGVLVSIPQPDAEQHFNRPNKFALLRRGPYQVLEVRPRTVTLIDFLRSRAGRNPESFQWPKYNLALYYSMGDILPAAEGVPEIPVEDVMLEPIRIFNPPVLPSVILRAIPLEEALIQDRQNHCSQLYL
jgi:hypothetical protein